MCSQPSRTRADSGAHIEDTCGTARQEWKNLLPDEAKIPFRDTASGDAGRYRDTFSSASCSTFARDGRRRPAVRPVVLLSGEKKGVRMVEAAHRRITVLVPASDPDRGPAADGRKRKPFTSWIARGRVRQRGSQMGRATIHGSFDRAVLFRPEFRRQVREHPQTRGWKTPTQPRTTDGLSA